MKKKTSHFTDRLKKTGTAVAALFKRIQTKQSVALADHRTSGEIGKNVNALSSLRQVRLQNPVKSVGMKLFLTFFISILVFVLTVGFYSYSISKGVLQNKVSEASLQTVIQAGQKLDSFYQTFEELSMQIMLDKELQQLLSDMDAVNKGSYEFLELSRKIGEKLNVYLYSNKSIKAIHLIKSNGEYINVTGTSMNGSDFSNADWFKSIVNASGKVVWLDTKPKGYSETAAAPAFAVGRALRDTATNKLTAVMLIEVTADVLGKQIAGINMGEGGTVQIVNTANKYIYTDAAEKIGKDSPFPLAKEQLDKDYNSLKSDNGDYQVVFYKSPVSGWLILGGMPISELVRDAKQIFKVTWIIALLAALAAVAIGYFVVRMIGRPLINLRNLMQEGAQGNLKVRANFKSQDEIGQLGKSFDTMMEQITSLVQQTSISASQVLETAAELSNSSKITATSAKEIAVATEEISAGASGLAAESEKGNELTNQIGQKMKNVIEANLEMGTAAADVQSSSEQGTKYMSDLIAKTNVTETMIRNMVEKVDKLKESTRSIRKILEMLNNITKQTNILSLNATIEAARAGAAGKGFMVVADEIRKLADQSRQSINVVGEITETIQREIDETVGALSNAYPIFQEQIVSVKEADTIFKQVQNHMSGFIVRLSNVSDSISELDQSQAILSDAMSNVSAVAQESLATSEQVASLSQEQLSISESLVKLAEKLEDLSNSLNDSLTRFRI